MTDSNCRADAIDHSIRRKILLALLLLIADPAVAFSKVPMSNHGNVGIPLHCNGCNSSTKLWPSRCDGTRRQNNYSTLYFREEPDIIEIERFPKSNSGKRTSTHEKSSDFQSRMKRIVIKQQRPSSTQIRNDKSSWRPDNAVTAVSLQEFADVIEKGRRESQLVVVKFHASWCKTCLSLRPSFNKAALTNPNTLFLDVPVTETNANLHQGLGVPSVPFGQIYHPEKGLIVETKLSRQSFSEFLDLIQMHSSCIH